MLRALSAFIFVIWVVGCATVGEQTRMVVHSPPPVASRGLIEEVPFIAQAEGHCGPATLAMVMNWGGKNISMQDLAPEVLIQSQKGSLPLDLISASRRHGLFAIPITGMANLLTEINAGHPVIVLENQGLSWWPRWHFAVAIGYDLKEQELILHSGEQAYLHTPLNYFERGWKLGEYWALVVLPPDYLSATASELEHLQAAVALETANQNVASELAYGSILKRWPESLGALMGLANLAYKKGDFRSAVTHLQRATRLHPESKHARHNLAVAKKALSVSF